MFEKELERARKQLVKLLQVNEQFVPFQSIANNDKLQKAYRTFFGAEVGWWVYEERGIRSTNPRFDLTGTAQREQMTRLDEVFVRHARFDTDHLLSTIDAAIKTRLNFLCRPRTTLKWFVYRGDATKLLHEISMRLDYFYDYGYLTNGIRAWIDERSSQGDAKTDLLSVVEFEKVVEATDNDAILDLSQQQFVNMLDPLYEFFAEYNEDLLPETVPTEAVIVFLDDKGALPLSQALEKELYNSELKWLTRKRFLEVVDYVIADIEATGYVPPGTTAAAPAVFIADNVLEAVGTSGTPGTSGPAEHVAHDEQGEIINQPVGSERTETVKQGGVPERAGATEATSQTDTTESPTLGPLDVESSATDAEKTAVGAEPRAMENKELVKNRIEKLGSLLDDQHTEKIIKKLFNKDALRFHNLLDVVLQCSTWKEAAAALDRGYVASGIPANSTAAMELAQAVHKVYL